MFDTTRQVPTRIGDLFFDHDYPTNPTVERLYNEMDFQRACQLYRWALPIVGLARWRQAFRDTFGLGDNEVVLTNTFQDRLGVLTLNESTPYMFGFTNVAERPVVFDVPPGLVIGLTVDFWQQSLFPWRSIAAGAGVKSRDVWGCSSFANRSTDAGWLVIGHSSFTRRATASRREPVFLPDLTTE